MKILIAVLLFSISINLTSQQSVDINQSIQLSVQYLEDSKIKITWLPKDDATGYTISTRLGPHIPFTVLETITDTAVASYTIENVDPDINRLEVKVVKLGSSQSSGYIVAGDKYTPPYIYKKVLLVIEEDLFEGIIAELSMYSSTLIQELWDVEIMKVSISDSVQDVKFKIQEKHNQRPFEHMLLIGNKKCQPSSYF